jgi:hypothetical protein
MVWVAQQWYPAESHELAEGYVLKVADLPAAEVAGGGVSFAAPVGGNAALAEAVRWGPCEILTRALRGSFCLHASAVQLRPERKEVVGFAGSSGAGKSTLALLLEATGAVRVCEDLLPIVRSAEGAFRVDLGPGDLDPAPPVRAICILAESPDRVELDSLAGAAAVVALVRHTVAARLFGPRLLTQHLEFCTDLAQAAQVFRLRYPRHRSVAPLVAAELLRRV